MVLGRVVAGGTNGVLTPAGALKLYLPMLNLYEQAEILDYPQVHFVGQACNKVRRCPSLPTTPSFHPRAPHIGKWALWPLLSPVAPNGFVFVHRGLCAPCRAEKESGIVVWMAVATECFTDEQPQLRRRAR